MNEPAVILFDGVCNLCNGAVDFVIRRDRRGYFKFAALQSEAAIRISSGLRVSSSELDSIVLVEDGAAYVKSTAALRIARRLGALWPMFYFFIVIPRPWRDAVYDWIARNRYRWFGKRDLCRVPTADERARFME